MFGDRPRVTLQEWKERVRPALNSEGFNDHKLDRLEAMFEQSFQINPAMPSWKPGIDQAALDQTMKYLHEHHDDVIFDDHQLGLIQEILQKYINVRM
jgi:hypothetical protein